MLPLSPTHSETPTEQPERSFININQIKSLLCWKPPRHSFCISKPLMFTSQAPCNLALFIFPSAPPASNPVSRGTLPGWPPTHPQGTSRTSPWALAHPISLSGRFLPALLPALKHLPPPWPLHLTQPRLTPFASFHQLAVQRCSSLPETIVHVYLLSISPTFCFSILSSHYASKAYESA